jgi:hypothetical protein
MHKRSFALLAALLFPQAVFGDIPVEPRPPVPFTGLCYCELSYKTKAFLEEQKNAASKGLMVPDRTQHYLIRFDLRPLSKVRDDEKKEAKKQCEESAAKTKFKSSFQATEMTPKELLLHYCQKGGDLAPAADETCKTEDVYCSFLEQEMVTK